MGYNFRGFFNHILVAKLKTLMQDIKKSNKEVFENVTTRKNEDLKQISFWESKEKEGTLTIDEIKARWAMV